MPANAVLKLETRGTTSEINNYVYTEAMRILEAAAQMYDVKLSVKEVGGAAGCGCDEEFVQRIAKIAQDSGLFTEMVADGNIGGSEDCTYFMEKVQQRGGQATYVMVGTARLRQDIMTSALDFDEAAMQPAAAFMVRAAADILK